MKVGGDICGGAVAFLVRKDFWWGWGTEEQRLEGCEGKEGWGRLFQL